MMPLRSILKPGPLLSAGGDEDARTAREGQGVLVDKDTRRVEEVEEPMDLLDAIQAGCFGTVAAMGGFSPPHQDPSRSTELYSPTTPGPSAGSGFEANMPEEMVKKVVKDPWGVLGSTAILGNEEVLAEQISQGLADVEALEQAADLLLISPPHTIDPTSFAVPFNPHVQRSASGARRKCGVPLRLLAQHPEVAWETDGRLQPLIGAAKRTGDPSDVW